jgi:hypothetical protein
VLFNNRFFRIYRETLSHAFTAIAVRPQMRSRCCCSSRQARTPTTVTQHHVNLSEAALRAMPAGCEPHAVVVNLTDYRFR